jgi:hypothetical protein
MRKAIPLLCPFLATLVAAELPVREVILYKNGVGYFARAGELKAGESARLDFKAAEMDDVLKSLTVNDLSGGKIAGLRYDSAEPLERKLAEFPFAVGGAQSLAAFLDQLKGSRVELRSGAENLGGVIVSGRAVAGDDKRRELEQVVLLLDSGDLRTLDLSAVSAVRFAETEKQQLLRDYLGLLEKARAQDRRSVYIDSTEAGSRRVAASYMTPAPVWKSSYRLVFGTADATLEGWAIVDNTTGEDWTNVRLAVVSGRPVSFISRLFEPRYVARRTAELAEAGAAGPVVFEGGIEGERKALADAAPLPAAAPPAMASALRDEMRRAASLRKAESLEMPRPGESNVAATAAGRDLGELFEYRFDTPVTVKRGQSAMLPFVQQKLTTRKLLIYREEFGQNPMSAAELTNSTGKTLDGGPLTVFDQNSYAGEALMETLKNGDKRLISYAVDLGTRITTNIDSRDDLVREIRVRRGVMTTRTARVETKVYTMRNVDPRVKTVVVDHPLRPEYKLTAGKPIETTSSHHRFEVRLAAGATEKFAVSEEYVYEQSTAVSSYTPDTLFQLTQNKALSAQGKAQLDAVLAKKREVAANDGQLADAERRLAEFSRDQERIRQNIASLNSVAGQQQQVQKYAAQLADTETRIAALRDQASELRKKKSALETELKALIDRLDF